MKKWKIYHFAIFIILCILLNLGGRLFAEYFSLPLWLDSLGTILCAYTVGPICGSIVGLTGNLMHGMLKQTSLIYGITSVAIGLIVGFLAKRKMLENWFGTMTIASLLTFVSVIVSVPLNLWLYGGSTGNIWGDGVIGRLKEFGWPFTICSIVGQFYIDFPDKVLSMMLLYAAVRFHKYLIQKTNKIDVVQEAVDEISKTTAVLLVIFLAGQMVAAPVRAESPSDGIEYNNYVQTVYSSNNGLPCGEANDITQTNDGILWVGTYAGLYRYNGSEFRRMDNFETVRNVNCLYVDGEGRLWIGTNDNGFAIAINEKNTMIVDQTRGLPSNSVRGIIQSADGFYYIGTSSSMQILTLNSGMRVVNTLQEINYTADIAADTKGHVTVVTNDGRLFLLLGGQIMSSRQITNGSEIFRSCTFTSKGQIFAGTTGGRIYTFNIYNGGFLDGDVIECEGLTSIKDLYFLDNGELIVSADNGIGYLDTSRVFHPINTNGFNNSIDNMLMDYQGNMWFTSSRLGLLRMAPSTFRDVYSTAGMDYRVVNAVTRWQGNYYFGTDKGLDAVDADCRNRINNELTDLFDGIRIRCMMVDSRDSLWVCTYGSGLYEIEADGTIHNYNITNSGVGNQSRLVIELSDGTILAGGDTGINFIRDHEIVLTLGHSDGLINSMILTATELTDGRVLAGTDGNGIAVIKNGEITRMITRKDGLTSEVILRTVYDPKSDGIFIVTSNSLCYMANNGKIRTLKNFPYFNNYDVFVGDDEDLFVMSSAGLYIVDRDELLSGKADISYELLNSSRGLSSALTANSWAYSDEEGNLYLCTDNGVFIINTDQYASSTKAYRMTVASLRLDGETVKPDRSMNLNIDRGVSRVELFPEIINYSIQDPNVGYFLEGFDNEWTIQPQSMINSIVYTNLAPGKYTFRLAVFDNNKQNILAERTYKLTKGKEIFDNGWFSIYMIVVLIAAVVWFTWFFVRTQVQRTMELQKRELALAHKQVQMGNDTVVAIAKAVDAKDERTSQHSQRVSLYSVMIAQTLGWSDEDCESLRKTALMHDIGKIGIPDAILNKPARLTDDEYEIMKSHTLRGAEILGNLTLIDHVVEGALCHHERYDGRGYPNHLQGEDIPINARIIGVADAFDAMTANRVYRKQMDFGYVLDEMRKGKGTQFDPQMVDILLGLIEDGKIDLKKLYHVKDEEEKKDSGTGETA